MIKPVLALCAVAALSGCATMTEGTKSQVAIETPGVEGAACTVANASGKVAASVRTPGSVTLPKGRAQLTVTCSKPGYQTASVQLNSTMADKAKLQMPTGYVIDAASGAMWSYPARVTVSLTKS